MRNKIFFLFILSPFISFAQPKAESSIRQVLAKQEACWNAGDLECFMQGYWKSDSLKFVGKSGVTYGWQKTLDNYKRSYPDTATMGRLGFSILELKMLSPNSAYVLGKWHLGRSKGDVGGYFTLIFQKIDGKWMIVCDHTS
jgi:ketosteroid isomerase-like protein